jgi:hypothetical protein
MQRTVPLGATVHGDGDVSDDERGGCLPSSRFSTRPPRSSRYPSSARLDWPTRPASLALINAFRSRSSIDHHEALREAWTVTAETGSVTVRAADACGVSRASERHRYASHLGPRRALTPRTACGATRVRTTTRRRGPRSRVRRRSSSSRRTPSSPSASAWGGGARNAFRVVVLRPRRAASLRSTGVAAEQMTEILPPWPAFHLELTDSPIAIRDPVVGGQAATDRVDVQYSHASHKPARVYDSRVHCIGNVASAVQRLRSELDQRQARLRRSRAMRTPPRRRRRRTRARGRC